MRLGNELDLTQSQNEECAINIMLMDYYYTMNNDRRIDCEGEVGLSN